MSCLFCQVHSTCSLALPNLAWRWRRILCTLIQGLLDCKSLSCNLRTVWEETLTPDAFWRSLRRWVTIGKGLPRTLCLPPPWRLILVSKPEDSGNCSMVYTHSNLTMCGPLLSHPDGPPHLGFVWMPSYYNVVHVEVKICELWISDVHVQEHKYISVLMLKPYS